MIYSQQCSALTTSFRSYAETTWKSIENRREKNERTPSPSTGHAAGVLEEVLATQVGTIQRAALLCADCIAARML